MPLDAPVMSATCPFRNIPASQSKLKFELASWFAFTPT
jgi:hypothetical protein